MKWASVDVLALLAQGRVLDSDVSYRISLMDRASAAMILRWRYPAPYSFYNLSTQNEAEDLREMLDGTQYAVHRGGELAGFFAFGPTAQVPGGHRVGAYAEGDALDIGLGMRPDLAGRGAGLAFVQAGITFAGDELGAKDLRLSVATFNRRAIRVYERAGFVPGIRFHSGTGTSEAEFLLMTRLGARTSEPGS